MTLEEFSSTDIYAEVGVCDEENGCDSAFSFRSEIHTNDNNSHFGEKSTIVKSSGKVENYGQLQANDTHLKDAVCDKESGSSSAGGFSFRGLSVRKKVTFVILALADLAACACFSLLSPFFPGEAAAKDMPQYVIGLVFSCFEFWIFLSSPLFGHFIPKIGARVVCVAGQFVAGICFVLFGTLYLSPAGAPFTVLCFLLRTFTALGAAAFITASFTIVANEFPGYVVTVFSILETFQGLGYILGPLVGGALYDAGGFGMPFYVMGSLLIIFAVVSARLLPDRNNAEQPVSLRDSVRLLASPIVIVAIITLVSSCYSVGFLDAVLAVHVQQYHLSGLTTGSLFMLVAVLYSLLSPFYGWLTDRKNFTFPLLISGNLLLFVSLMLIGPSPLLPFLSTELWLIIVSLVLQGLGEGAATIPALNCCYIGARRLGFKDGLKLDSLVSGVMNSAFHFGTLLGPTLGSAVMDAFSYEWSATFNAMLCLSAAVCLIIYITVEKICLKHDDNKLLTEESRTSTLI